MLAGKEGKADIVEYLLGRPRVDIEAKTTVGDTALDIACRNGHLEVVKLLVAAGARINPGATDVRGALASATLGGKLHVFKYLVEEAGADERWAGGGGMAPLIWAASIGQADIVKYLLGRQGINIDAKTDSGHSALSMACRSGHLKVVKLLVAAGARVESQAQDDPGALASAILGGKRDVVTYLMEEAGPDERHTGHDGVTPLMCAVEKGDPDIVKYLLGRPGIDVEARDGRGQGALDIACEQGQLEVVKLLVAAGARVDAQASNEAGPLIIAIQHGNISVAEYLVEEANADADAIIPDMRLSGLRTACDFAGATGVWELVRCLMDHGANPSMCSPKLLYSALRAGEESIVSRLIDGGIDVTTHHAQGLTPLHAAVRSCPLVVPRLVEAGAEVDAHEPVAGFTPLMEACRGSHLEAVKSLVEAGADPFAMDHKGLTPWNFAAQEAVISYLRPLVARRDQEVCLHELSCHAHFSRVISHDVVGVSGLPSGRAAGCGGRCCIAGGGGEGSGSEGSKHQEEEEKEGQEERRSIDTDTGAS
jgi:ankyrin repeat protein